MQYNASQNGGTTDPLPSLVDGRFRILTECRASKKDDGEQPFQSGTHEAQLRARRLDEQIIRTVAVSVDGLLAQLRLLSAFYQESANGAGRRGSLLIQSIAAGIERLASTGPGDRDDSGPYIN
jgi:hypothetical protein